MYKTFMIVNAFIYIAFGCVTNSSESHEHSDESDKYKPSLASQEERGIIHNELKEMLALAIQRKKNVSAITVVNQSKTTTSKTIASKNTVTMKPTRKSIETKPKNLIEVKTKTDMNIQVAPIVNIKQNKTKHRFVLKPKALGQKKPTNLKKNIRNYRCKEAKRCNRCLRPCGWCHEYGCVDSPKELCPEAKLGVCPNITHKGPILAPHGVRTSITVNLNPQDPIVYEKDIICQIDLEDRLTNLKGLILNDIIYCYPIKLETETGGVYDGIMRVMWGGKQKYSNGIKIRVYKCENEAKTCESCRSLPDEYGCGWCNSPKRCVVAEKCKDFNRWSINRLTCHRRRKVLYYV